MNIVQFKIGEILEIDGELFKVEYNERFFDYELKECSIDGEILQ